MLAPVDPLTSSVDLGICLNCRDYRGSSDFDIAGSFNDPFKSRTNIALTLRKQPYGVGVPVDR